MMRREFFTAAPLLALPAFLSSVSAAGIIEDQTDCERIFHSWNVERDRINGPEGSAMSEADYDQAMERFNTLDDIMRATPAESARDFILKVIALSEYGTCGIPSRQTSPELWIEADRFLGLE